MEFKDLPPLEQKCLECNGVGTVEYEYVTSYYKRKRKAKKVNKAKKDCEICRGKGKLLTEFGKSVIQLVRDWNDWDQKIEDLNYEIRELKN